MPDSGSTGSASADLAALPQHIAAQSLSQGGIILPKAAALEAIDSLGKSGRRLIAWEGWVKFRDGTRAKSLAHGGSFALPREAAAAAEAATQGIERAQARWDRDPEYSGAELYFLLTFAAVTT